MKIDILKVGELETNCYILNIEDKTSIFFIVNVSYSLKDVK